MTSPLTPRHVDILRQYLADAAHPLGWAYPEAERVHELMTRLAERAVVVEPVGSDEPLGLPSAPITSRDVMLLSRLGRLLIKTASVGRLTRVDVGMRLALGESLLELRDVLGIVVLSERPCGQRAARRRRQA